MGTDDQPDKRHLFGPRPVGALVPAVTRPAFKKRSPAGAHLMAEWPAIVGPALAAVTVPRRLSGATLTLACAGPVAMELQLMSGELCARINGHLGRIVVERLRFVQDHDPPQPLPRPARQAPAPDLPRVPEGPLKDALRALGQAIASAGPEPLDGAGAPLPSPPRATRPRTV